MGGILAIDVRRDKECVRVRPRRMYMCLCVCVCVVVCVMCNREAGPI